MSSSPRSRRPVRELLAVLLGVLVLAPRVADHLHLSLVAHCAGHVHEGEHHHHGQEHGHGHGHEHEHEHEHGDHAPHPAEEHLEAAPDLVLPADDLHPVFATPPPTGWALARVAAVCPGTPRVESAPPAPPPRRAAAPRAPPIAS